MDDTARRQLMQTAQRAADTGRACVTRFLPAEDRAMAAYAARENGVEVSFDGGWPEAERAQACFHPEDVPPAFTGVWMRAAWNARYASAPHRALLGSLMALGLDRAFVGDMIAQEGEAYLYVLPELAVRLPAEWTKAGGTAITVSSLDSPPVFRAPAGTLLRDTVASLRLDSILASGLRTSRARAADMIRQGLVAVDHAPEERTDRQLSPGQTLSVHGFGRIRVKEVHEPTRKDRLPVVLEVFGKT